MNNSWESIAASRFMSGSLLCWQCANCDVSGILANRTRMGIVTGKRDGNSRLRPREREDGRIRVYAPR
jgi:hypothetical protein